ncbi:MAG: hypothetical protein D6715_05180 [Calditrichaeota bacterium]|nr:MAG: hypothetical protein D6715_05180 [Calditrichota bacterium]
MASLLSDLKLILSVLLILIPVIIGIYLVFKMVVPRRPALGIGLAGGLGLLGYWLARRRLKQAFDVEKALAEHNAMMDAFKKRQKERYNAVMANKTVIEELEKQKRRLEKDREKYRTEIALIDAELKERRRFNDLLLKESGDFLEQIASRSEQRRALLDRYLATSGATEPEEPHPHGQEIEIAGYRLKEV